MRQVQGAQLGALLAQLAHALVDQLGQQLQSLAKFRGLILKQQLLKKVQKTF